MSKAVESALLGYALVLGGLRALLGRPTVVERRLAELLLYVAEQLRGSPDGDSVVKVSLTVALADFDAYRRLGRPITGATYLAMPEGPRARELPAALALLEREGRADLVRKGA
jgi:hypothetical protein